MRPFHLLALSTAALSATFVLQIDGAISAESPSASPAAAPDKLRHSPPDDGSGELGIPSSSFLVKGLLDARPNEDLVICIAGCRHGNDRVVFATASAPKAPAVATSEPAKAEPAAAAPAAKEDPGTEKGAKSQAEATPEIKSGMQPTSVDEAKPAEEKKAEEKPASEEQNSSSEESSAPDNSSDSSDEAEPSEKDPS